MSRPAPAPAWLAAFPLEQASKAVDVMVLAWEELARRYSPHFNRATSEPDLTHQLAQHIRDVVATRLKLLGHWGAENVEIVGYPTPQLGKLKRIRTDIVYMWNDARRNLTVIFEFKKLTASAASGRTYCSNDGVARFVSGSYARGLPVALMAGIVLDDRLPCIDCVKAAVDSHRKALAIAPQGASPFLTPSGLFPTRAAFDTIHYRPADRAPPHGTITVSHVFLPFGYTASHPACATSGHARKGATPAARSRKERRAATP